MHDYSKATHRALYDALVLRLRDARSAAGLTQVQVANALGKPQSFVSKVESGERRLDPIELLWLIRIYKVHLGDVLPDGVSELLQGE